MPYIIKNGLTYTGNLMPITQVQYDALSEAEKNNGIAYFIVDSDAVLDASDVGLGEGNVEDLAGSVAVIETSPATAIHAVGDFILWNGQLYTVISRIEVGQALTVGSNITATSAGSELTSLKSGLSNLNNRTVPQNLTVTPGTNITLGTQIKACIIDGFIYLSIKGRANAAITNSVIATISGDKNFVYPTTIPIGIGDEWNITDSGYGFLSGKSVTATIPNGKWFHLVATIPYA